MVVAPFMEAQLMNERAESQGGGRQRPTKSLVALGRRVVRMLGHCGSRHRLMPDGDQWFLWGGRKISSPPSVGWEIKLRSRGCI